MFSEDERALHVFLFDGSAELRHHLQKSFLLYSAIKRRRKELKLTQVELAKLVGVSRATIGRIEQDRYIYTPSKSIISKILQVLSALENEKEEKL